MRKIFLLVNCIFVLASTSLSQSEINLEIGSKLPRKYIPKQKVVELTLTSPSQMYPSVKMTIADVDYTIAFDGKTRAIEYIRTMDDDFRTVNGLRVDQEITFTREELHIVGFEDICTAATPDGWFPVVGSDHEIFGFDLIGSLKPGEKKTGTISAFTKAAK